MRFAILCRVSTQEQESSGLSLIVQEQTLLKCVEMLSGTVVKKYIGQEHSTEGFERPILDQLLLDARNKEFDAVIICDLSRLTRDSIRSKVILAELKKQSISLYVQTQLYSLDNPETNLIVGLLSEINAFQASIQVKKSLESKIELARRGFYMFGTIPYGRVQCHTDYSKPPEWGIDPDCLIKAQEVYDLYINQNVYVDKMAGLIGMSRHTIFSILKDKGIFRQSVNFQGDNLIFETPIPSLFTEEQRLIIKDRLKKNKKNNGNKFDYLLSGYVHCSVCGLHHVGLRATNTGSRYENLYYRHSLSGFQEGCAKHVPLPLLNKAVIDHISEVVSNSDVLKTVIFESNQVSNDRKKVLEAQKTTITQSLLTHEKKKERIIKLVIDGVLDDVDAKKSLEEVKDTILDCQRQLAAITTELASLVDLDVPDEVLQRVQYIMDCFREKYGKSITEWEFKHQRQLVEWFLGIGEQNGVFVSKDGKDFLYTIKSNLGTVSFGSVKEGCYGVSGYGQMTLENLPAFRSIFSGLSSKPEFLYTKTSCSS